MGHLGFFVNDMPAAIAYLEEKGYPVDYDTARYDEDGKTIRLIFLKEEINGFPHSYYCEESTVLCRA